MMWEITNAYWADSACQTLMEDGWEPISVIGSDDNPLIWFRRKR
jgi:hypothetical protein